MEKQSKLYKMIAGAFIAGMVVIFAEGCAPAGGNSPGHEYMMDMGHSIAYEANMIHDFKYNRWDPKGYYALAQPRSPIEGTIPRGYVGLSQYGEGEVPEALAASFNVEAANGFVPYYYEDTEEERTRAMKEIISNPYPITAASLAHGKELYTIYCGICHGDKGDGSGYLVRDDGMYPAQPALLTSDDFITSSNGRYYHAIMYGKNVMTGYADKLSYKERWEVIMYIRSLQAASKQLQYDEKGNTLNTTDRIASVKKDATNAGQGAHDVIINVGMTVDSATVGH